MLSTLAAGACLTFLGTGPKLKGDPPMDRDCILLNGCDLIASLHGLKDRYRVKYSCHSLSHGHCLGSDERRCIKSHCLRL